MLQMTSSRLFVCLSATDYDFFTVYICAYTLFCNKTNKPTNQLINKILIKKWIYKTNKVLRRRISVWHQSTARTAFDTFDVARRVVQRRGSHLTCFCRLLVMFCHLYNDTFAARVITCLSTSLGASLWGIARAFKIMSVSLRYNEVKTKANNLTHFSIS